MIPNRFKTIHYMYFDDFEGNYPNKGCRKQST